MITAVPYIASFLAGATTLLLCLNAKSISSWLRIMDIPDERKQHRSATPLMGGVALQIAFMPVAAAMILMHSPNGWAPSLLVWLACIVAMTLVGIADDRHSLSARDRLLISFLVFGSAAILDPLFNVRVLSFEYFGFELGLGTGWFAAIFTAVCCVGLVNAVNMADGKNGLVIGLCLGWVILIALRAPAPLLPVIGLLIAVLVVLLAFNLRGRLFLGDGGAYGLATAIGLAAVMTYNTRGHHAGRAIAADELMLLFAVPVLDSFRLTFARLRRGQSPMAADRDHLHHHLQNRFGWPGGLLVYFGLALVPAAVLFVGGI
jgi:UDP-GlcNAc:undecaprenyl-phosphate/decaprenyl-phosphate GlcNAc-1-phosphate transferase